MEVQSVISRYAPCLFDPEARKTEPSPSAEPRNGNSERASGFLETESTMSAVPDPAYPLVGVARRFRFDRQFRSSFDEVQQ